MCEIHAYHIDDWRNIWLLWHSMNQLFIIDVGVLSLHYRLRTR